MALRSCKLFGQRRLDLIERRADLSFHFLPLREILLERLGAGRRQRHPLPLEREAGSTLCVGGIVAAQLIDQLAHFLNFTIELLANLPDIRADPPDPPCPCPGLLPLSPGWRSAEEDDCAFG